MTSTNTVKFEKVNDRRGNPVLGLWRRGTRFYFQTQIRGENSPRRIPLKDEKGIAVVDLKGAQAAIEVLRVGLEAGTVVTKKCPGFSKYADHYLEWVKQVQAKTNRTLATESSALKGWKAFLRDTPLNHISKSHINAYAADRKKNNAGLSNRTINVDVNALASVLKLAVNEEYITRNVAKDWERLPYQAPKRGLIEFSDVLKLCAEATRKNEKGEYVYESGQALADYLKLMAFSGARRDSALAILWDDVNWDRKQLWLRKTKFSKTNIHVDMNADLEAHLRDMHNRAPKDAKFLFPSPVKDNQPMATFLNTFERVREKAGLPDFHIHDLRHYFVSHCVMAGVNFMQIAAWVGHNDGGVLIGKIYGHLSNAHGRQAAAKVSLGDNHHATGELVQSGPGDVKPAVQLEQLEPTLLAPVVDSGAADADLSAPRG